MVVKGGLMLVKWWFNECNGGFNGVSWGFMVINGGLMVE